MAGLGQNTQNYHSYGESSILHQTRQRYMVNLASCARLENIYDSFENAGPGCYAQLNHLNSYNFLMENFFSFRFYL